VNRRLALLGLVVALIVAGLWLYGLGAGGRFYHQVARAPLRAASDAPYYRDSILHVGLAHLLGLGGSLLGFRIFVLGWWWAALAYLACVLPRTLRLADAALLLGVLATLPATMIVHAWTCHPDAPTLLLTALLLFTRRPVGLAGIAALGAWNHLAMWLVICLDVALLWLAQGGPDVRRRLGAVALGLVVGVASHALLFQLCGIHVGAGRFAAAVAVAPGSLLRWAAVYPLYFAHLLWLPVLVACLWRTSPRIAAWLIGSQVLALAVTCFTRDTTRVFAVLSWGPLLIGLVLALRDVEGRRGRVLLRWLLGLGMAGTLVAPKYFVWEGRVHGLDGAHEHLRTVLAPR
jgi:hypothetical protein